MCRGDDVSKFPIRAHRPYLSVPGLAAVRVLLALGLLLASGCASPTSPSTGDDAVPGGVHEDEVPTAQPFEPETWTGAFAEDTCVTMPTRWVCAGGGPDDYAHDFSVPGAASRADLTLTWNAIGPQTARLELIAYNQDGDLGRVSGTSPLVLSLAEPPNHIYTVVRLVYSEMPDVYQRDAQPFDGRADFS